MEIVKINISMSIIRENDGSVEIKSIVVFLENDPISTNHVATRIDVREIRSFVGEMKDLLLFHLGRHSDLVNKCLIEKDI